MRGIEKGGEVWLARTPAAVLLGLSSARARERRRRRRENEVGQWNVVEGLSSGADVSAVTRGVADGTVAGMGAGVGETEQNRNLRFPNPEPPVLGQNRFNFGSAKTKNFAQQLEIWPK